MIAWPAALFSQPAPSVKPSGEDLPPWLYESFTPTGDIRRFSGETLKFDIDFMIFSNAAESQISLYEEGGKFKCIMVGETKGFIGFMTSYVKHIYKSTFELTKDRKAFRTSIFEREVIIGDERERIVHAMDYHSMRHHYFRYKNDELIEQRNDSLKGMLPLEDVLAAFYNFRNGAHGNIEKGKTYIIPTFLTKWQKKKWTSEMRIQSLNNPEKMEFEEDIDVYPGASMLMKIKFPSDLFETKEGQTYFWSSDHMVPTQAIFKDFILFGDLRVKLVQRISRQDSRSNKKR